MNQTKIKPVYEKNILLFVICHTIVIQSLICIISDKVNEKLGDILILSSLVGKEILLLF